MAKSASNAFLDGALYVLKTGITASGTSYGPCTKVVVCSSQPTNATHVSYTPASGGYQLAVTTASSSLFTIADGDTSGRKITFAGKSGLTAVYTGHYGHIALITAASAILYVTTGLAQPIQINNPITIPAFDIEVADPT